MWECEHQGSCSSPCGAPCSRLPCNLRCKKPLPCGHRCPTVCGEACPSAEFCQECGSKKATVVDYINMSEYADQDLNRDPVIVLSCGHMFAISTLDGHVVAADDPSIVLCRPSFVHSFIHCVHYVLLARGWIKFTKRPRWTRLL